MSLILNIDTALETAGVSIAEAGTVLESLSNSIQKDHAVFLHDAVRQVAEKTGIALNQIDAIAVTEGPGSYTGLRVGMATAKGLCYALQKPLITVGTLPVMASAAIKTVKKKDVYYCPMIDARRMEVFTAIYDDEVQAVLSPVAMILNEESFDQFFADKPVVFFGSGANKWERINKSHHAAFIGQLDVIEALASTSFEKFKKGAFADLVYSEPLYIKEFFSP